MFWFCLCGERIEYSSVGYRGTTAILGNTHLISHHSLHRRFVFRPIDPGAGRSGEVNSRGSGCRALMI